MLSSFFFAWRNLNRTRSGLEPAHAINAQQRGASLVSALPESVTKSASVQTALAPVAERPVEPLVEPWLRTALFGTSRELTALLDGGLDPNTKTERGTTLLMAAVLDPEKVRLLMKDGLRSNRRAITGTLIWKRS
jgi:hypothetical protein